MTSDRKGRHEDLLGITSTGLTVEREQESRPTLPAPEPRPVHVHSFGPRGRGQCSCGAYPEPKTDFGTAAKAFARAGQWPEGALSRPDKEPPCSYYELTCPRCKAPPGVHCVVETGATLAASCHEERFQLSRQPLPGPGPGEPANAKEIAEAMQGYLASNVAMLLFSKLTLYRAIGENPRVVVRCSGMKFRVHIERSNGEKEHFNRDGEP